MVTFKAGQTITLKPGFHAQANSDFHAVIDTALLNEPPATDGWEIALYSYDEKGRIKRKYLFTEDIPLIRYTYLYNLQDQVTRSAVRAGQDKFYHFYDYNDLGRLSKVYVSQDSICPNLSDIFYTYNQSGLVDTLRFHETSPGAFQTIVPYQYNDRLFLTDIGDVASDSLHFSAHYTYFPNGNIDIAEFNNQGISPYPRYKYEHEYDTGNRLQDADFFRYSGGGWYSVSDYDVASLDYDKNGNIKNLIRKDESGSNIDQLSYNYTPGTNRLSSVTDACGETANIDWDAESSTFTYDDNGNVSSLQENGQAAITDIQYDYRNLPTSLMNRSGNTVVYRYNVDGQRIFKKVGSQEGEYYIMDGKRNLGVFDENGSLKYWNILANGVSGKRTAAGEKRYYIKDHLGSTRAVVNDQGTVVEAHDYYPFGLLMPGRSTTTGEGTKEKFTGKELDSETGWYWFNPGRYNWPAGGRWLSVDPISLTLDPDKYPYLSISPYTYSLNNPVLYMDENGRWVLTAQLSARGQAIFGSASASTGLAVDGSGNVGYMIGGSAGGGLGIGAAGGLEFSFFPAAENVDEVSGFGALVGGYIGIPGDMVSGEINASFTATDFRLGGSASGIPGTGSGAGIGVFLELSYTHISQGLRFNLKDVFGKNNTVEKDNPIIKQLQNKLGLSFEQVTELLTQIKTTFDQINEQNKEEDDDDETQPEQ